MWLVWWWTDFSLIFYLCKNCPYLQDLLQPQKNILSDFHRLRGHVWKFALFDRSKSRWFLIRQCFSLSRLFVQWTAKWQRKIRLDWMTETIWRAQMNFTYNVSFACSTFLHALVDIHHRRTFLVCAFSCCLAAPHAIFYADWSSLLRQFQNYCVDSSFVGCFTYASFTKTQPCLSCFDFKD